MITMRLILIGILFAFCIPAQATTIGLTLELDSSSGDPNDSPFAPFAPPQSVVVEYSFDPATPDSNTDPTTDVNAPFVGAYVGTLTTKIDFYQGPMGTGTFRGGLEVQPNIVSGLSVIDFSSFPGGFDGVVFFTEVNVGLAGLISASGVFAPYVDAEYSIQFSAAFNDLFPDDSLLNITQDIFNEPASNVNQSFGGISLSFDAAGGSYEVDYSFVPQQGGPGDGGNDGSAPAPATLALLGMGLAGIGFRRQRKTG